ncbi:MAG: hypothetical protein IBJ11_06075 [Phycisphaerales bacterium]|nr:hypothetical protein [Phycisphaerales bacterium]
MRRIGTMQLGSAGRWRLGVCLAVLGVAGLAAVGGCSKPLLSPKDSRTQFDRYDRARGQFAPQVVTDEFGVELPNIRGRLSPKM